MAGGGTHPPDEGPSSEAEPESQQEHRTSTQGLTSRKHVQASTSHITDVSSSETAEVKEFALRYVGHIESYLSFEWVETKIKCLKRGKKEVRLEYYKEQDKESFILTHQVTNT